MDQNLYLQQTCEIKCNIKSKFIKFEAVRISVVIKKSNKINIIIYTSYKNKFNIVCKERQKYK